MGAVKQQFFPTSDRPEVLVEVQMPEGTSIEATADAVAKVEAWLKQQPEAKIVTTYIGQGAPRFFFAMSPELPDPSFAKIVVLTANAEAREALKLRLRQKIAEGLAPEARLRVTQLVFGPYSPFPVAFRVTGPDPQVLRGIADQVQAVMRANPGMRQVNRDWGERVPTAHFVLDQDRLRLIGLSPDRGGAAAAVPAHGRDGHAGARGYPHGRCRRPQRRRAIGSTPPASPTSPSPSRDGRMIPLEQIGHVEVRMEDPILRRRDRMPTITVRGDIDESLQPPEVSMELQRALQPITAKLPAGYRIEMAGSIEESAKANVALAAVFPIMMALMLTIIMFQVRSFSATSMVMLTAPLGLIGAVPVLLLFHQPFGFNAILGLIGLAGILMRNTLILIGQIQTNQQHGLDPYHAVVEATVQRARPVILTALAAVLAFIPLTQFGVLGLDGLYADRRYGRRHRSDSGLPAGALRHLVPREAAAGRESGLRGTADRE